MVELGMIGLPCVVARGISTEANFYRKQFSNISLQVEKKKSAPIQVRYF